MTPTLTSVSNAVTHRRSVRAFRDTPVDADLLRDLIERATRAPSGGNLQPWHLHIVSGEAMVRLKAIMAKRVVEAPMGEGAEYPVYPPELDNPYRARRFAIGEAMYSGLGIPREDKPARMMWFARNYQFFGAPVGLFCYVDRRHGLPQWSDCGMMLQTLMLLLVEAGLDSCAQEAWTLYHRTIGAFVDAPEGQMLFTGMAIGYRDADDPVNAFAVPRAPLDEVARFHT